MIENKISFIDIDLIRTNWRIFWWKLVCFLSYFFHRKQTLWGNSIENVNIVSIELAENSSWLNAFELQIHKLPAMLIAAVKSQPHAISTIGAWIFGNGFITCEYTVFVIQAILCQSNHIHACVPIYQVSSNDYRHYTPFVYFSNQLNLMVMEFIVVLYTFQILS